MTTQHDSILDYDVPDLDTSFSVPLIILDDLPESAGLAAACLLFQMDQTLSTVTGEANSLEQRWEDLTEDEVAVWVNRANNLAQFEHMIRSILRDCYANKMLRSLQETLGDNGYSFDLSNPELNQLEDLPPEDQS